ncbi:dentin sialophosphoprotein-like protein [Actinidia rufa]|uniref:Dentin sialophosphoprotein-like protein n=1 Tax=Actinidia rufa TaxID=165716 RepID=A0A7J0H1R7_9ERIC|nr:dentin sialophosphoprotein-like protein [Actinidia rufa]
MLRKTARASEQQRIQQLEAIRQNSLYEIPSITNQASVSHSTALINGAPVSPITEASNYPWATEPTASNTTWLQCATPAIQGSSNGFMFSPEHGQSMSLTGLVPPQVIQGANLFGHDSGQCFDNGMNLENLPQVNAPQKNAPWEEFHERQELVGPSVTMQERTGMQVSSSYNAVALDPTEEKILFGDDNIWDAFGSSVNMGVEGFNVLNDIRFLNGLPSVQSGSWSSLMQSAVAETSSNDIGLQEEWSGLSSQKTEVAPVNRQLSRYEVNTKQQTVLGDNNPHIASVWSSGSVPFSNDANFNISYQGVPGFQQSGQKSLYEHGEKLQMDSTYRSIPQSSEEGSKWLIRGPLQKPLAEGSQIYGDAHSLDAEMTAKSTLGFCAHQQIVVNNKPNDCNVGETVTLGPVAVLKTRENENKFQHLPEKMSHGGHVCKAKVGPNSTMGLEHGMYGRKTPDPQKFQYHPLGNLDKVVESYGMEHATHQQVMSQQSGKAPHSHNQGYLGSPIFLGYMLDLQGNEKQVDEAPPRGTPPRFTTNTSAPFDRSVSVYEPNKATQSRIGMPGQTGYEASQYGMPGTFSSGLTSSFSHSRNQLQNQQRIDANGRVMTNHPMNLSFDRHPSHYQQTGDCNSIARTGQSTPASLSDTVGSILHDKSVSSEDISEPTDTNCSGKRVFAPLASAVQAMPFSQPFVSSGISQEGAFPKMVRNAWTNVPGQHHLFGAQPHKFPPSIFRPTQSSSNMLLTSSLKLDQDDQNARKRCNGQSKIGVNFRDSQGFVSREGQPAKESLHQLVSSCNTELAGNMTASQGKEVSARGRVITSCLRPQMARAKRVESRSNAPILRWRMMVEDDGEMIEDRQPVLRPKRQLILATQSMQQLFRPPPPVVLSAESNSCCETAAYLVARLALGDACSSIPFSGLLCAS